MEQKCKAKRKRKQKPLEGCHSGVEENASAGCQSKKSRGKGRSTEIAKQGYIQIRRQPATAKRPRSEGGNVGDGRFHSERGKEIAKQRDTETKPEEKKWKVQVEDRGTSLLLSVNSRSFPSMLTDNTQP